MKKKKTNSEKYNAKSIAFVASFMKYNSPKKILKEVQDWENFLKSSNA